MNKYKVISVGDPAPWFTQRSLTNPRYTFDTTAGRYIVLCFFLSAEYEASQRALATALAHPDVFNDEHAAFFGVSVDPSDEIEGRIAERYPGYRHICDFDRKVASLYGISPVETSTTDTGQTRLQPKWFVLDPTLRVLKILPFRQDGGDANEIVDYLRNLPRPEKFAGIVLQAPILVLPNVIEPALCDRLIALYEAHGGRESGFMREIDGKTIQIKDGGYKRRRDHTIEDDVLKRQLQGIFMRRVVPEIAKVHQFKATRMERYIVACYDAADNAHFNAHRDNTTKGTAHRRFAVSINLNEDFEGGEVGFPEYGPRTFKAPKGGAVVFSCSLLHAVSRVTRGKRYAFLPFLYDEEAARIREANNAYLGEGVSEYRS